ncbi:MAG: alpha/beta fold hydrolase [bacterium]|nr:alpha/beta fold hydrolase [bacterium]
MAQRSLQSAVLRMPGLVLDSPSTSGRSHKAVSRAATAECVPARPSRLEERVANRLFLALSPRLERGRLVDPPRIHDFERFEIDRSRAPGRLSATWFPASGTPRGAVLMVHPWIQWGQAYFHRRGRIEALRASGYHVMTFDLGGVGGSSAATPHFYDRDLEDALAVLRARGQGVPVHLWGVSAGGYWAHLLLSRATVSGAVFEDVSRHLIVWSGRMAPWGWPCYQFFRHGLSGAYRFLDLRRHAPHLGVRAAAYVSGERDRGVLPAETAELARLSGAKYRLIPGADHLESIKHAGEEVLELALETFELAARESAAA